jgi:hypothetical protein
MNLRKKDHELCGKTSNLQHQFREPHSHAEKIAYTGRI